MNVNFIIFYYYSHSRHKQKTREPATDSHGTDAQKSLETLKLFHRISSSEENEIWM